MGGAELVGYMTNNGGWRPEDSSLPASVFGPGEKQVVLRVCPLPIRANLEAQ